jgi:hypothetical protein
MNTPQILTLNEAADFLGVGSAAVAQWARDGLLPACARSEGGELLFYRWRVQRDGPKLAASEVVRFRTTNSRRDLAILHDGRRVSCGCTLVGNGEAAGQPIWLCPDARALQSVARLTAGFAAAAPDDPFFCRLARATADALARHFGPAQSANESSGKGDRPARCFTSASASETAPPMT